MSEDFVNQFEKLLETLNTISTDLQIDVIQAIESKLNEYKNSMKNRTIVSKTSEELENNIKSDVKSNKIKAKNDCNSNEINEEFGNSSEIISNSLESVRKSKRISNRMTKQNETKIIYKSEIQSNKSTEKPERDSDQTLSEPMVSLDERNVSRNHYSIANQKQLRGRPAKDVIECLAQTVPRLNPAQEQENQKCMVKRKWRRAQTINDLKCRFCGKIWRSVSHLEIHLRSHTGEKVFKCKECDQQFTQLAGLQVHMRRHNNDRPFKCEVCDKAFYTKIDLTRHKTSHKEFKQITQCCEICGKGFSDSRRLKSHIRFVHEKKESVVCEICGHKTHGKHLLYAHKRVKHGDMAKYACPVCNTLIGSRSAFVIHLRAHADIKPCACDVCGKPFRSTSQVARHKLAHKEGRHECDICKKKFKTPHHLRRHQVIHSGDKPFGCHLCEYKCNVNSNVVKHVKSVHKIVDFSSANPQKRSEEPAEEEALQKGSIVTQEVLKDIAITKGQKLTLKELKILDQKKREEKELKLKIRSENAKQKQQSIEHKVCKPRKDILDDAIASTFRDQFNTICADNPMSETQAILSDSVDTVPTLPQYVINNSGHIFEITADSTQTSKPNTSLAVGDEQHFKSIITLHFANN